MNQLLPVPTHLLEPSQGGDSPGNTGPIIRWYSHFISSIRYLYPSTHLDTSYASSFPAPPVIYDRSKPIEEIVDRIKGNIQTLVILGVPGVGKTCVASAVLYEPQVVERFGVRRHWANLSGIESLNVFKDVVFQSLACEAPVVSRKNTPTSNYYSDQAPTPYVVPSTTGQQKALPRLLVLNDFENVWNSTWQKEAQDFLYELQDIPGLKILITTQGAIGLPEGWWRLEINPLSPHAAKLLFFTIHLKSDSQVDLLLKRVAYLPRSIVWMAQICQAKDVRPSDILKEWNRGNYRFLQLPGGDSEPFDDPDASIDSWVRSISQQLPPEAKRLFSILSMLPSGLPYGDLLKIDSHLGDIRETSLILSDMSLASVHHSTQISIPPLLRPYSLKYNQLERRSLQSLYSYFFALARDGLYKPGDDKFPQAIKRLVGHQLNLEAILQYALDEGYFGAVEPTLQYSTPHYSIQPRIDIVEKALNVAQQQSPDILLTAHCLKRMGEMSIAAGSFGRGASLLGRAIHLFKGLGKGVAAAECEIGIAKTIAINDTPAAISHLERTRQEFVRLGNTPGQARCSHFLGELYLSVGRRADGRSAIEGSLTKYNEISDKHGAAKCGLTLVQIHLGEGRSDDARSALSALDNLREFGDRSAIAKGQRLLAALLLQEGRIEDARLEMRKTISDYEWLGHHLDAAFCMWDLGRYSDDEDAIELYQRAIPIFQDCRFTFAMAECRLDLGLKYMMMGRFDEALLHLEISKPQLQENKTGWISNFCLAAIIVCLRQDGQTAQAEVEMKQNRAVLLDTARMHTQSPWKLFVLPADGATESEDGQILFMVFSVSLSRRIVVFVDGRPPTWDMEKMFRGEHFRS